MSPSFFYLVFHYISLACDHTTQHDLFKFHLMFESYLTPPISLHTSAKATETPKL